MMTGVASLVSPLVSPGRFPLPAGSGSTRWRMLALILLLAVAGPAPALGQGLGELDPAPVSTIQTAPVVIDGKILFRLRGVTAYPAKQRAARARDEIIALARDDSFDVSELRAVEEENVSSIYAGDTLIVNIADVDAELEHVQRKLLVQVYVGKIRQTILEYRRDRTAVALAERVLYALGATAVLLLLLFGTQRLFRWLLGWTERRVKRSVQQLARKSHHLIQAGQVWGLVGGLLRLLRLFVYLLLAYVYLNTVLGLFPWTRPMSRILFRLVLDPLHSLLLGFVNQLPNLAFLLVLWFVMRYLLKLVRGFFSGIGYGRIEFEGFDPDWADPTYRIVRFVLIAFAVVIAYPYIPGSDSLAFKGVSVFIGILLSLGSSSFIANIIAGLTMTYRGAFKEGERIRMGEVTGTVEEIKLMITKVRTPKNENVIIPNSTILNTEVTNYSQMARAEGIILHTTVGIGYDTPWRQVEAMLLMAAGRTEGLERDPAPFVLQTLLGDFAVNYELNAWCKNENRMPALYSALHANIQDVFNEHGVQIMSPAYEADTEAPKTVPPENWYLAPANKPE